jgi:CxxC motif-containing protein
MATDHQLCKVCSDRPTDQRIAFKHIECPDSVLDARLCIGDLMLKNMLQDAIEIISNFSRKLDASHN